MHYFNVVSNPTLGHKRLSPNVLLNNTPPVEGLRSIPDFTIENALFLSI